MNTVPTFDGPPKYIWNTVSRFAWPARVATLADVSQVPYPRQDFSVRAVDGVVIRGWVWSVQQPEGVVLVCHGRSSNTSRNLRHVQMLADNGYTVVAFDFRGCGASDAPSRRWFNSMWEPLADLDAVADYVAERFAGDGKLSEKVALFGLSFGGNMALAHAGNGRHRYAALVVDSTPLVPWGDMMSGVLEGERRRAPVSRLRPLCDRLAVRAVVDFTRADQLYQHAVRAAERLVDTPLLMIVGQRDAFFDVEQSVQFVHRHYAGDSELMRVARGRHLTNHIVCERAYRTTILKFLQRSIDRKDCHVTTG